MHADELKYPAMIPRAGVFFVESGVMPLEAQFGGPPQRGVDVVHKFVDDQLALNPQHQPVSGEQAPHELTLLRGSLPDRPNFN
jgi:hypothetical protein